MFLVWTYGACGPGFDVSRMMHTMLVYIPCLGKGCNHTGML